MTFTLQVKCFYYDIKTYVFLLFNGLCREPGKNYILMLKNDDRFKFKVGLLYWTWLLTSHFFGKHIAVLSFNVTWTRKLGCSVYSCQHSLASSRIFPMCVLSPAFEITLKICEQQPACRMPAWSRVLKRVDQCWSPDKVWARFDQQASSLRTANLLP